jgi:perosamine synthetase
MNKERILAAIKKTVACDTPVALHEPLFSGNEWKYVKECLDTGWVSSVGEYVDRFEQMIVSLTGVKKAVAVINGTAALHISLLSAGVRPDDEVLVPALTFVATANAVVYCGAVPHFVDSEEKTLGLDPHKLAQYLTETGELRDDACFNRKTGRRIRAVIPVHIFGHPVDLDPLKTICERFWLTLIEDAAESIGSYYKGRHTGNWGKLAILSFNGNKTITTGGGGAILTNDESLGNELKHITTTAKIPHPWEYRHDRIGYNYRMPNINAALGCAQLEQLETLIQRKRRLADLYEEAFHGIEGVRFFKEQSFARSNYWLNVLLLDPACEWLRDDLLELLNSHKIMARPAWTLMHRLAMFTQCPRMDLGTAESLERRIINIPSSPYLGGQVDG